MKTFWPFLIVPIIKKHFFLISSNTDEAEYFLESLKLSWATIVQIPNNFNLVFHTLLASDILRNIGSWNNLSQNKMISIEKDILSLMHCQISLINVQQYVVRLVNLNYSKVIFCPPKSHFSPTLFPCWFLLPSIRLSQKQLHFQAPILISLKNIEFSIRIRSHLQ